MLGLLDLIQDGNGEILAADPALALGIFDQVIEAEARRVRLTGEEGPHAKTDEDDHEDEKGPADVRLRAEVEEKLARLPLSYIDQQPRGDLLSRVTNDVDNISSSMQQSLSQILNSVLTVVAVLSMMLWISPLLAVIAILTVPLSVIVTILIAKRSQVQFAAQWERTGSLNAHIEEMFTGHTLVTVFADAQPAPGWSVHAIAGAQDRRLVSDASFGAAFANRNAVTTNRRGVLDKMNLNGADIEFTLAMTVGNAGFVTHTFTGKVDGNTITGTVRLQRIVKEETFTTEVPWRATRAVSSTYFAPTGAQPSQAMEPAKPVGKKP